jgi:hypothetical protein
VSYDVKCDELARAFLPEGHVEESDVKSLAQAIQYCIEDWLSDRQRDYDRDHERV